MVVRAGQLLLELANVQQVVHVHKASQFAQHGNVLGHVQGLRPERWIPASRSTIIKFTPAPTIVAIRVDSNAQVDFVASHAHAILWEDMKRRSYCPCIKILDLCSYQAQASGVFKFLAPNVEIML